MWAITAMRHVIRPARLAAGLFVGLAVTAPASAGAASLVDVQDARLAPSANPQVIAVAKAEIHWNQDDPFRNLTVGDVRVVAESGDDHRATLLAKSRSVPVDPVERVSFPIPKRFASAIAKGNRVVLTASQHAFNPSPVVKNETTLVTVAELQPPRLRDHIGRRDCSDRPLTAAPPADYRNCDLVGAYLDRAGVSADPEGTKLGRADLAGATMVLAGLTRANFAGARLNGVDASLATIDRVSMAQADATEFVAAGKQTKLVDSNFPDARFVDATFEDAQFSGTSLIHATLDGAHLAGARLDTADMTTSRLVGTDLRRVTFVGPQLYFANLTDAKLRDAVFPAPPIDLQWALLCRTEMPTAAEGTSDRDCTG
jgi:uncharacterized protein YjbI with pentapeptide repeats